MDSEWPKNIILFLISSESQCITIFRVTAVVVKTFFTAVDDSMSIPAPQTTFHRQRQLHTRIFYPVTFELSHRTLTINCYRKSSNGCRAVRHQPTENMFTFIPLFPRFSDAHSVSVRLVGLSILPSSGGGGSVTCHHDLSYCGKRSTKFQTKLLLKLRTCVTRKTVRISLAFSSKKSPFNPEFW